ncbi:MAG: NAD(P)/FAD-dependent oxidoreductase [Clostridia bacterium]|nr:NAD(P)/FAD-dependent oxidoreductase [Clostridia bacterium]
MMTCYSAVIVGGGAAGLTAAVFLARELKNAGSVLLLEKQPRVGKKLLATGNGTCNISNIHAAPARYHGAPELAKAVLSQFSPEDTLAFFETLGLECTTRPDGKCYPVSEQASAVLDCLRLELSARGVEERCDTAVLGIKKGKDGFLLSTSTGEVKAKTVLLAPGGAAAPSLGGSSDGYALLTDLGHTRTPLFPSIVQLRTDTTFVRSMKGIRVDARISVKTDREVKAETGEILFTDYGISGPAAMQVSRVAADWERQKREDCVAILDLFPEREEQELFTLLKRRTSLPGRTCENFLTGFLNKRVGQTLLRSIGKSPNAPVTDLTDRDLKQLAGQMKNWVFPVTGTNGFGGAQVTAGGIRANEVEPTTLQSRLVPGLFLAGEVLDVDGDCGGFNLQFAFSGAAVAAKGMLSLLKGRQV